MRASSRIMTWQSIQALPSRSVLYVEPGQGIPSGNVYRNTCALGRTPVFLSRQMYTRNTVNNVKAENILIILCHKKKMYCTVYKPKQNKD